MIAKVADRINRLATDTTHGASWLTRQAISTLSLAAKESQAETVEQFIDELRQIVRTLTTARPGMVSIANYACLFLSQVLAAKHQKDLPTLKSHAVAKGMELIKASKQALSRTVEYASGIIKDNDTIATCSYSSTVCQVLAVARHKDTKFRVIIAESRFGGTSYGEITAAELAKHLIPTEIIADSNIRHKISGVNKTLLGADAVIASGYVVNGIPSLELARASKAKQIPVYVVCETAKFDFYGYIHEYPQPGFDAVPLNLCKALITEKGTMTPDLALAYIQQKAEEMAQMLVE